MFLLVVIALLPLPASTVSLRTHLSNSLKLKCQSLLYRSLYVDDQCYFAILEEFDESKASKKCSSVLKGAKAVVGVAASIFAELIVDKSKFLQDYDSGAKYVMCAYETGYKCESPEIMLNSGNCFIRAPKKMNFVDANNYCQERSMTIPAPVNYLENRIVRDILVKDPVWVQKSLVRDIKFKWSQVTLYSKWTTCDRTSETPRLYAGSQNAQWGCNKDTASVVDQTGYWSNGGVNNLMDVVCAKPAVNEFTKDEKTVNYHADTAEKLAPLPASPNGVMAVCPTSCYTPTRTTSLYDVMGRATVETQRGCEALCDAKSKCAGFSFKEAGSTSSCALLTVPASAAQSAPTTIFLKKTTGCAARTNMTAEFGDDPCLDSFIPITQAMGTPALQGKRIICPQDANFYVIRAIDANGRRITLDNDAGNWLEQACGMWVYRYTWRGHQVHIPFVAAVCAKAGDRCPCKPLIQLVDTIGHNPTYPVVPNVINPCQGRAYILWDVNKVPTMASYHDLTTVGAVSVNCKAGMWLMWTDAWGLPYTGWGVNGLSCVKK